MSSLEGFDNLERKLLKMEKSKAKNIVRKASRVAQRVTLKEAKANAVSMVGGEMGNKISGALQVKAARRQKPGEYRTNVEIDAKRADEFVHNTESGERYFIPTAIEYGHVTTNGGKVPPIPYMRTAAEKTNEARIKVMEKEIKKGIDTQSV